MSMSMQSFKNKVADINNALITARETFTFIPKFTESQKLISKMLDKVKPHETGLIRKLEDTNSGLKTSSWKRSAQDYEEFIRSVSDKKVVEELNKIGDMIEEEAQCFPEIIESLKKLYSDSFYVDIDAAGINNDQFDIIRNKLYNARLFICQRHIDGAIKELESI